MEKTEKSETKGKEALEDPGWRGGWVAVVVGVVVVMVSSGSPFWRSDVTSLLLLTPFGGVM